MKNRSNRVSTMFLALLLLFALTVPAFAAPLSNPQPRDYGFVTKNFVSNGVTYSGTFTLHTRSTEGAYSTFDTTAYVTRTHNNLKVTFTTTHYGHVTETGGARSVTQSGQSESNLVQCSRGIAEVTGYGGISGSGSIAGVNFSTGV